MKTGKYDRGLEKEVGVLVVAAEERERVRKISTEKKRVNSPAGSGGWEEGEETGDTGANGSRPA